MPKESKADSSVSNSKGTSTKYSDFDLNGLKLQDADKVIKTDIRKGSVYHVPAEYKGDDSFRISTLMCYVSGAYRNVDDNSGKVSVDFTVCTRVNWKKTKEIKRKLKKKEDVSKSDAEMVRGEDSQEKFLHDYYTRMAELFENEDGKGVRRKIGRPSLNFKQEVKSIVYDPIFADNHPNHGEVDPDRPPRFRVKCWTKDPSKKKGDKDKESSAKKKIPTEEEIKKLNEKNGGVDFGGHELLTQIQFIDGRPCPLSDLIERPFLALFHILPGTTFFGPKSGIQLKATKVLVGRLLEKKKGAGITEADREDAMREMANVQLEDEDREDDDRENLGGGDESDDEKSEDSNKPAAAGSKKTKKEDKEEKKDKKKGKKDEDGAGDEDGDNGKEDNDNDEDDKDKKKKKGKKTDSDDEGDKKKEKKGKKKQPASKVLEDD